MQRLAFLKQDREVGISKEDSELPGFILKDEPNQLKVEVVYRGEIRTEYWPKDRVSHYAEARECKQPNNITFSSHIIKEDGCAYFVRDCNGKYQWFLKEVISFQESKSKTMEILTLKADCFS